MGLFDKIKSGLKKTRDVLTGRMDDLVGSYKELDDDFYEELSDLLIMADVGVAASERLVETLRETLKEKKIKETSLAREEFRQILADSVGEGAPLDLGDGLSIILVIGVNGVGKTTSIGKIAHVLKEQGKNVMLAAGDTFRAAAAEQLSIWAQRNDVPLVRQTEGADPAAVVFDAISSARKSGADVLIVDTAGRLQNKKNLMDELAKINRVIDREAPGAARETLLVLDASTGQNALIQAQEFSRAASITGLVLTKLDGTAKGGIILAVRHELGIPVKFIGVGEGIDDLRPFEPREFIEAFFEED